MDDYSTDGLSISGENSDWDDTELIKAYDRAIEGSKRVVAQRLGDKNEKNHSRNSHSFHKGSHCRAIYDVDNIEYEAVVDSVNGDTVTVTFLGYGNQQNVKMNELKNSGGRKARARQIEEAALAEFPDLKEEAVDVEFDEKPIMQNGLMANMMVPPPPPFPPHIMKKMDTKEKDALNAMLMSWYMSGYYTGYYQGIQNT